MSPKSVALIAAVFLCTVMRAGAADALTPPAQRGLPPVATALKSLLMRYISERGKAEHISAASLSVSLPDRSTIDVAAGTTSYGGKTPVTPASLYQIGSNTKVFTAILMLQLESAGKVTIRQTVGRWLPQYAPWKTVTISKLFDMTSGIPTYDDTRAWEDDFAADPLRNFSPQDLIAYVTKKPLQPGWHYSNTNYMLAQLIEEKASGRSYTDLLRNLISSAGLSATYYYPNVYPAWLRSRTVAGYYVNSAAGGGLMKVLGRNVRDDGLSWTQSAGGIVATPHDLAQWARDLYQGSIVTAAQRRELETLVSTATGRPIQAASGGDPRAFGLGVAQIYQPGIGRFWYYEGMTLGYRMVHAYFPDDNLVIAIGLNSQPNADQNKVGQLATGVYRLLSTYELLGKRATPLP